MTEPESRIGAQLREIIGDFLDVPPAELTPERTLEELGIDSLDFMEILFLVEDRTGLSLPGEPAELWRQIHCLGDVYRLADAHAVESATGGGSGEGEAPAGGPPTRDRESAPEA